MEVVRSEEVSKCSQLIRKRREKLALKKEYFRLLERIILLAVTGYLLFTQVFLITQASGNGMFPAVKDGDLLVGFRLQKSFLKNDVVIYEMDGKVQIGRILAQETDVVMMDDTGTLLVNGTVQNGEILFPTYAKEGIEYPYTVPEGCVFILGDYRTQTKDSRDFGCVKLEDVKAKVITILRRRAL